MVKFLHAKPAPEMMTSVICQSVEPRELLSEREIWGFSGSIVAESIRRGCVAALGFLDFSE
jgi:hypothetical protein